jgi:ABC-2 type transport system permease protein
MTSTTIAQPVPSTPERSPSAPDPGIPFARLIRVEWGKATDTRAARWLLGAVAASTVGLVLVPVLARTTIEQTYTSYLGYAAVALSILLPVVSILTLTSEWSQRTVLSTFTQEPRRLRVVHAKIVVSVLLAGAAAVFGGLVTAGGLGVAAATGGHVAADLSTAVVVGYLLYVLLNVLTGVALGALVHNSAAAIVSSFALPIAFALLGRAWQPIAAWLDYSTAFSWVLDGQWAGHTPQILVSVVLWVALPLGAGLVRTVRREIT